jgi:hypothetical protein
MKIIFKNHIYESVILESIDFFFDVEDVLDDELVKIDELYSNYKEYLNSENSNKDEEDRLEQIWSDTYQSYMQKQQETSPSINFASRNAVVILNLLGLPSNVQTGYDKIDDFIARIDNAYDLIHTQVIPPTDSLSDKDNGEYSNNSRWIDNGLDEEDIKNKLDRLKAVAIKGKELGLHTISWG